MIIFQKSVTLYQEGSWKFQQAGAPLPFEDLDSYNKPKRKDRLDISLPRKYVNALELPLGDESAYGREIIQLRWGTASRSTDETFRILNEAAGGRLKFLSRGAHPPRSDGDRT